MSTYDPSATRERMFQDYRDGLKSHSTPKSEVKLFLDDTIPVEGAKMFSAVFKAEGWLTATGKPDLDITSLMLKAEDFPEEDRAAIPEVDPHYKWNLDVLYPTLLALKSKMKCLFVGPTGSGKTTFHQNLAGVFNQPFYRLGGRGDMESDTILGRQDMQKGTMSFLLGEFPKKYIANYYILLDEPWKLPSNINMTFQRVFERNGLLQIDEARGDLADKTFLPGPHTHLMLADNVVGTGDGADKYAATMVQDGSTLNRMDLVLKLDYMKEADEVDMLISRFGSFLPRDIAIKAVQVANLVRAGVNEGQLSVTMSPRNLISWMELAQTVRSYEEAFKWVMVQRYADDNEREAVNGMYFQAFAVQI